jgi:hypothetical protein
MHLRIDLDERDPPTGRIRLEDGPEHPFTGWLGLLGEMAELLDAHGDPVAGDRDTAS